MRLIAIAALVLGLAPLSETSAATFSSLHSFCSWRQCNDGKYPEAGLLADVSGNLMPQPTTLPVPAERRRHVRRRTRLEARWTE